MQVGEPVVGPSAAALPPDAELVAELVSVIFKSPVKVSRAKDTVAGPHWERGKESEVEDNWSATAKKMRLPVEPYSRRAAVYLVSSAEAGHDVEVKVRITRSQNIGGPAKLFGNLRGLAFEGDCPTAVGEHVVSAKIRNPPDAIQTFRGKIGWVLSVESPGMTVNLGTSLVEVYFVLGTPTFPFKRGVWAEALRFLCGRVGVVGQSQLLPVAAKIASYCHGGHGLRYETKQGSSRYEVGSYGGDFALWDYLRATSGVCNCYDQAAAVQALSGALGIDLDWRFLSPFGYLRTTNLVGVGQCNNPFFGSNESKKVVANDSKDRTAFGNHAFISFGAERMLDACAGPHLGTETAQEYVQSSIDNTPRLYRQWHRPGTAADIVVGFGVTAVK
jgi:hypothetical protein